MQNSNYRDYYLLGCDTIQCHINLPTLWRKLQLSFQGTSKPQYLLSHCTVFFIILWHHVLTMSTNQMVFTFKIFFISLKIHSMFFSSSITVFSWFSFSPLNICFTFKFDQNTCNKCDTQLSNTSQTKSLVFKQEFLISTQHIIHAAIENSYQNQTLTLYSYVSFAFKNTSLRES